MKRFCVIALALCLALLGSGCSPRQGSMDVLAAGAPEGSADEPRCFAVQILFGEDFWEQFDLTMLSQITSIYMATAGDRVYRLMASGDVYYYDIAGASYHYLTSVPVPPRVGYSPEKRYSALDSLTRAEADEAVFQLIADQQTGALYGYCATSGQIGRIDENGFHAHDVALDNSLPMKGDSAWPESLSFAYIEGGMLRAYFDKAIFSGQAYDDAPGQGCLLSFDLSTGQCRMTDMPQAYMMSPFEAGKALLLLREKDGTLRLCGYEWSTGAQQEIGVALPESLGKSASDVHNEVTMLIGGLAYEPSRDAILLADGSGIWISEEGGAFARHELKGEAWDELNPATAASTLPDGTYLLLNGNYYIARPDA